MITAALAVLAVAALLFLARLVRGPSLADRIVALDGIVVTLTLGIIADAAATGQVRYLDAPVVVALLGFVGTSIVARFIERRGA
jgi:multicomponent Na+:H+ antiporter subunit F